MKHPGETEDQRYIALGIQPINGFDYTANGVLLIVKDESELSQFDQRELLYYRQKIPLSDVEIVEAPGFFFYFLFLCVFFLCCFFVVCVCV